MPSNFGGVPFPPYDSSKPTPEEHKSLLSDTDVEDRDHEALPRYKDEEYPGPRERAPSQESLLVHIARNFIFLIIGATFLVPMLRSWYGRMRVANRLVDPSRLLSNGTHEFKRTVLIVSIDGLR
jgi:hypothetical protein